MNWRSAKKAKQANKQARKHLSQPTDWNGKLTRSEDQPSKPARYCNKASKWTSNRASKQATHRPADQNVTNEPDSRGGEAFIMSQHTGQLYNGWHVDLSWWWILLNSSTTPPDFPSGKPFQQSWRREYTLPSPYALCYRLNVSFLIRASAYRLI